MNDGSVESHPGRPLEQHLLATRDLAAQIAATFALPLTQSEMEAILLHDAGKAHPTFQKRLATGHGKFGHAEPSAALVLNETRDLLCAEAVRRHHSHLQDVAEFVKFWGEWEYEEGHQVIKKLKWWPGALQVAAALGRESEAWLDFFPDETGWEDLLTQVVDTYGLGDRPDLSEDWLRLRLLCSLLVTADRYDAAVGGALEYHRPDTDDTRLKDYIAGLSKGFLSDWREHVREEAVARARRVLDRPGVYTLTLPTGAGKTLAGLQIAMEAAARLDASGIIYVLPFVSLVEQNAGIAEKLLQNVREDHYLAYAASQGEEMSPQERFIEFFRYWQEPVVVTTLAKLWEVLYSPKVNDAMSFHRLSRAVVILDEPQAIPARCWEGFGKTLDLLSSRLGTTFILMTATQPELAHGPELAPEQVKFPKVRHELHWIKQPMSVEEAAAFLETQGVLEKDSLIVMNTRQSALTMWWEMKRRGLQPYFLSRWVTPEDRARTMQELKEKERREVRCLVATQVVEAGIDLDFDLVLRDLGPLDSIIQVAGRCNRNARPGKGQVFITKLVDERRHSLASYVYDGTLLNQTELLLNDHADFDEEACPAIVRAYYRNVRAAIEESTLWANITRGKWGEYVPLFEETARDEAMLIVDYDGTVPATLVQLGNPVNAGEDKMAALQLKRRIYRWLSLRSVPVPVKLLEAWFQRTGSMVMDEEEVYPAGPGQWVVRGTGIGRIYRPDVGFVPLEMAELLEG